MQVSVQVMAKLTSYRDLEVWQKAVELTQEVYRLTTCFPQDEKYGLTSQVRRSTVSVSANIAEGAGRDGNKEFRRFISIANGSLRETESHLLVCQRLGLASRDQILPIRRKIESIGRMLTALKRSLP